MNKPYLDSYIVRLIVIPILFISLSGSIAYSSDRLVSVDHILSQKQPPAGLVFEIVSDDEDFLEVLLPELSSVIHSIRDKFPELPIAIVSHGKEQFALTRSNEDIEKNTHSLAREFVDDGIDIHVCGTHAGWYGIAPEDFPDYVDVSPAGPTQIDDYEEMGYELIFLTD
jgi:intracellular sulfur oxidation DsrE/DsrF family protein